MHYMCLEVTVVGFKHFYHCTGLPQEWCITSQYAIKTLAPTIYKTAVIGHPYSNLPLALIVLQLKTSYNNDANFNITHKNVDQPTVIDVYNYKKENPDHY